MGAWNSRGLRGSMLEEAVNFTNQKYSQENLALCLLYTSDAADDS